MMLNFPRNDSSSAIQSLSIYQDSDEEGNEDQLRLTSYNIESYLDVNDASTSESLAFTRTVEGTTLPSSPPISPQSGDFRLQSEDESPLREPPPPRPRADFSDTSSPSSSKSRSPFETSAVVSSSLVSYGGGDDDEIENDMLSNHKRHSRNQDDNSLHADDLQQEQSVDFLNLPLPTTTISDADEPLIDVYEYLEQGLRPEIGNVDDCVDSSSPLQNKGSPLYSAELADVILPPEPTGPISEVLKQKMAEFFRKKQNGVDPTRTIQNDKRFRNPSIYNKLIETLGIDEIGSNFPRHVFNPRRFKPCDFLDEIARQQKVLMDKLEKNPLPIKVEASSVDDKKRRSKWDQGSVGAVNNAPVTHPTVVGNAFKQAARLAQESKQTVKKPKIEL